MVKRGVELGGFGGADFPVTVTFNDIRHAKVAWECLQTILEQFHVETATSGAMMESMSILAKALDEAVKTKKAMSSITLMSNGEAMDITPSELLK